MATARHHARLNAPADKVWELVRDPAGIADWLPGVDSVEMDGDTRVISTMGLEIREACDVDDDLKRFQYTITDGPIPFEFHRAVIDVLDDGDGCVVVYSIEVEPGDTQPIMDGVAGGGINSLEERFGA
jgi:carbon monoxide dehydrogenase subunit G